MTDKPLTDAQRQEKLEAIRLQYADDLRRLEQDYQQDIANLFRAYQQQLQTIRDRPLADSEAQEG